MNRFLLIIVAAFGLLSFNVSPAEARHRDNDDITIKDVGKVLVEDYRDKREDRQRTDRDERDHRQRTERDDQRHQQRTDRSSQEHAEDRDEDAWRHQQRTEQYEQRHRQRIESDNNRTDNRGRAIDQDVNARLTIRDPSWQGARNARQNSEIKRWGGNSSLPEASEAELKASRASGVPIEEVRRNTAANYSGVKQSANPYVLQGHLEPNVPSAQELKDRGFIRARGQFKTEVPAAQALPAPVELKPPVFRNDLTVGEAGEELLKIQKALEVLDSATPADIAASPKLRALRKYRSVYEARKAALIEALNSA